MAYEDALTRLLDNLPQTYAQIKSIQSADEQRKVDNLHKNELLVLERDKLKNKTINDKFTRNLNLMNSLGNDKHKAMFAQKIIIGDPDYSSWGGSKLVIC